MAGARQAVVSVLAPPSVSWFSVGFAVIAAVWLSLDQSRADGVALAALCAVYLAGLVSRSLAGPLPSAAAAWSLVACGVLAECVVYAGMAATASLRPAALTVAGPAAGALHGTFVAGLGGAGADGVWRLAVTAVIVTVLLPMVDVCVHGPAQPPPETVPSGSGPSGSGPPGTGLPGTGLPGNGLPGNGLAASGAQPRRFFGVPGDIRLPLAGLVVLLGGDRAAFAVVITLGVVAIVVVAVTGPRGQYPGERRGYRGDGWLAVQIGKFVNGRLPPLPPLFVGLLVTGVLAALGLRNLPGILVLTPVEAMLLAAFGSRHPHDGRGDWLVPPLIQLAEYVFLGEVGFARDLWPPLTFAVVAAAGFRHLDLAYRVRGGLALGMDRRGFGWEGRMIIAGIAAVFGVQMVIYPALAIYLWWLNLRDWAVGWSARHATVHG
jgi:hypothetical protein